MPVRFLAVGDVMVDVLAQGEGHAARVRLTPGGSALNAALSASGAGATVELIGRVGDDAAGRMARAELERCGVRATLSLDSQRPTGTFLVVDGTIRADRGANGGFLPEHLPAALDADITLVSGHLPAETVEAVLERSRTAWNALAAGRLTQLPAGGNAVFMNGAESEALTGERPADALRLLARRYRLACVTLGADGAIAAFDGELETVRPATRVASGEPFGAGDALAASMLLSLASGRTLRDALEAGCEAGALAAARPK